MTGVTGNAATCQESGYLTSILLFGGPQRKGVAACCINAQCITSRHVDTATKFSRSVVAER